MASPSLAPEERLVLLNQAIVECRRCPRLVAHRERIARIKKRAYLGEEYWGRPVPGFGDPEARVLLVGLAPGAHGSNRTGRMFTGDGSAEFLIPALHRAGFANQSTSLRADDGLIFKDLYIAAAAHCAPPGNRPTPVEIDRCRPYLVEHLTLLRRLKGIVCLGAIAWDALLRAGERYGIDRPKPRPTFSHGAHFVMGRWTVFGAYHPSRQNTQTGRLTSAMLDQVLERVRGEISEPIPPQEK